MYAENTEVPVEKSVGEIITLIKRAGADRIAQLETPEGLAIQFFLDERMLRFTVKLPPLDDMPEYDGRRSYLTVAQRQNLMRKRHRQRARALLLVIKAKLESVESGVETFDEAFLANVVMPDNMTVGEHALPAIQSAYIEGKMPSLMLQSNQ